MKMTTLICLMGLGLVRPLQAAEVAHVPVFSVAEISFDGPRRSLKGAPCTAHELSGVDGIKHDLVALLDLDDDGDLDVLTTEEVKILGVIWYENPSH